MSTMSSVSPVASVSSVSPVSVLAVLATDTGDQQQADDHDGDNEQDHPYDGGAGQPVLLVDEVVDLGGGGVGSALPAGSWRHVHQSS